MVWFEVKKRIYATDGMNPINRKNDMQEVTRLTFLQFKISKHEQILRIAPSI